MLTSEDLNPLLRPLSTCPGCLSTDVELKGIDQHLQISLLCSCCGKSRSVIVLVNPEEKP